MQGIMLHSSLRRFPPRVREGLAVLSQDNTKVQPQDAILRRALRQTSSRAYRIDTSCS